MKKWFSKGAGGGRCHVLVVLRLAGTEDQAGTTYTLGPGEEVLGRDDSCTIQIVDPQVSRRHVAIECRASADTFMIRDLDSVNGTRLNGRPVAEPELLAEEDVIDIGDSQLLFTRRDPDGRLRGLESRRIGEGPVNTLPGDLSR